MSSKGSMTPVSHALEPSVKVSLTLVPEDESVAHSQTVRGHANERFAKEWEELSLLKTARDEGLISYDEWNAGVEHALRDQLGKRKPVEPDTPDWKIAADKIVQDSKYQPRIPLKILLYLVWNELVCWLFAVPPEKPEKVEKAKLP